MTSEILQPPKLSLSRLLLLGASSVVLCISYLMSVFTPFPVAVAIVLYGRIKGYLVALLGAVVCAGAGFVLYKDPSVVLFYLVMVLMAVCMAEGTIREFKPVRVVMATGLSFIFIVILGAILLLKQSNLTLKQFVVAEVQQGIETLQKTPGQQEILEEFKATGFLEKPEVLADTIIENFPGYLFMASFFVLWVNMFLLLKSKRLLHSANVHAYTEKELLNFKMPFIWVYAVVIGFALVLWGKELNLVWGEMVGMNLLRAVGVFYFFQGLGVVLTLMDNFGVVGFFRTFLIVGLVFFVPFVLSLVGLFDTWFDFTKRFKKIPN